MNEAELALVEGPIDEVEACVLRPGESLEEAQWTTVIPKMSVKKFASRANVELPCALLSKQRIYA